MSRPKCRAALALVASGAVAFCGSVVMSSSASATPVHSGCGNAAAGSDSGWCGLYPGNAVDNVKELGLVAVSADGQTLTIQTQDADSGDIPATSFACLTSAAATDITHRLQATQCADVGGVWFPYTGASLSIDLTAYPQFLNTQFTVQVAASGSAKNANGDAFYNNFSVSTVATGGGPS